MAKRIPCEKLVADVRRDIHLAILPGVKPAVYLLVDRGIFGPLLRLREALTMLDRISDRGKVRLADPVEEGRRA